MEFCHTTSWGVSTRLIGGVIMTHGDDDGLRLPPAIAPRQIVIVPMLRDKPEDAEVLAYCEGAGEGAERGMTAFGEPVRALLDTKQIKSADKRWDWVRRGAPIIVEIGPRDAAGGKVTFMRRDGLRDGDKINSVAMPRGDFVAEARCSCWPKSRPACTPRPRRGWTATSARHHRPSTALAAYFGRRAMTTASRAGCARPGASPPARRWKRSTRG